MAGSMDYEAMSHADLVALVKAQRDLLDQRAERIAALEREAELTGQVVQAQADNAELRKQVNQQQAGRLVKETANATADVWLQWLATIDGATLSNRKVKAKRYITARDKRRQVALLQSKSGRFAKDNSLNDKFVELAGEIPRGLLALAKQRNMPARRFVIATLIAAKRALKHHTADEANLTKNEISQFVMLYRRKLPHLAKLHSR